MAHLTTSDLSLPYLLGPELEADVAAGFEVFALSAPGPYFPLLEDLGVTFVPVPTLTRAWDVKRDLAAFRELRSVLKELDLDVLHTHNPKTGVMGRMVGRSLRIPIIVNTCHGLWANHDDPALQRAAVYGAESFAAWFGDAQLYQNGQDHETLRRWVPKHRSSVVGNGVDLERFRFDAEAGRRFRAEMGIDPEAILVGGVGRMVEEKGIAEFSTMALGLAGKAEFVWIGPQQDEKADAVSGHVPGVRQAGMQTDMVAVYSALDIFALPTHREGFCRSAMEAAACGVPTVLSDIRGCREVGSNGVHLLLVPPMQPERWIDAVGSLIADDEERAALGRRAEVHARRAFDHMAVAGASLATYDRIAVRKGLDWEPVAPPARYLDPVDG